MNPITRHIVRKPYLLIEESQRFHNALMKSLIDGAGFSEMCCLMYDMAGETLAVLAGDALQAEAFGTIRRCPLPVERRAKCAEILAGAAGIDGICGCLLYTSRCV